MRRLHPGRSHRCQLYAHNPHLVCAVHPTGPTADTCLDFRADPNSAPDELWEPEGVGSQGKAHRDAFLKGVARSHYQQPGYQPQYSARGQPR